MPLPGAVRRRRRGCHGVEMGSFHQAVQLSCARGLHRGESSLSWSPGWPLALRQWWGAGQPALLEAGRRGRWFTSCRGTCTGHCHRACTGRSPRPGFSFLALEVGYKNPPLLFKHLSPSQASCSRQGYCLTPGSWAGHVSSPEDCFPHSLPSAEQPLRGCVWRENASGLQLYCRCLRTSSHHPKPHRFGPRWHPRQAICLHAGCRKPCWPHL